MAEMVTDPFPGDEAMQQLWLAAWGSRREGGFEAVLARSLCHIGAYAEGRLVGFVNVAWDGGLHGFILDTCVDPAHRRQGIALAMLERAIAVSRERGAQWLHVDCEPQLEGLYRQAGFGPTAAGLLRL